MRRLLLVSLFIPWVASFGASSPDKVPSTRKFDEIQREVETLRGKQFKHTVPVFIISKKELRAISDRELDRDYPGDKLRRYAELLAWLDLVPPHTDLKEVEGNYVADQVAGLYDSTAKEMDIPAAPAPSGRQNSTKALSQMPGPMDDIVFAHEFTHALEDQYWPLDDPQDTNTAVSSDRGTAHDFLAEGSATHLMIDAVPAQAWDHSPTAYFHFWNLLHSRQANWAIQAALFQAWKSADALSPGVPDSIARNEAMPYPYGDAFCSRILRDWGLDGLDYIYDHPPISSRQVMHPTDAWAWRQFPDQIDLPATLDGGWNQVIMDSQGEAGIAVLFGTKFTNMNRGLALARGWKGDHVGMYEDGLHHQLLLWASAWDTTNAAANFLAACVRERMQAHHVMLDVNYASQVTWHSSDGKKGGAQRRGTQVVFWETDATTATEVTKNDFWPQFTPPPQDAIRAAQNSSWHRFNPIYAQQVDGDYTVNRILGGVISRHDHNSVGEADSYCFSLVGECRHTASMHQWEILNGGLVRHIAENRQGWSETTLFPWGILASYNSAHLPQSPSVKITRASVLWGLGGSCVNGEDDQHTVHFLPFGLLYCRTQDKHHTGTHVIGTGVSHIYGDDKSAAETDYRVLGFKVWTKY